MQQTSEGLYSYTIIYIYTYIIYVYIYSVNGRILLLGYFNARVGKNEVVDDIVTTRDFIYCTLGSSGLLLTFFREHLSD